MEGPYDPGTLRSLQDWFIRYQLNSVPGVAEVASIGGFVRQYQIDVDPAKLRAFNIPLRTVFEAVERSNSNVGAKVVEANNMEYVVRGVGLIESVKDIEDIVLSSMNGTPVYVRNVAAVQVGPEFRRGVLDKGGTDAVGGVVVIRYGANALRGHRLCKSENRRRCSRVCRKAFTSILSMTAVRSSGPCCRDAAIRLY